MTVVQLAIDLRRAAPAGVDVALDGATRWAPTRRRTVEDHLVLPASFIGPATGVVSVAVTGLDWVWRVDELVTGGTTRYVQVQVSDRVYAELVDVDPATLLPSEAAVPAWTAAVSQVTSARDEAVAAAEASAQTATAAVATTQSVVATVHADAQTAGQHREAAQTAAAAAAAAVDGIPGLVADAVDDLAGPMISSSVETQVPPLVASEVASAITPHVEAAETAASDAAGSVSEATYQATQAREAATDAETARAAAAQEASAAQSYAETAEWFAANTATAARAAATSRTDAETAKTGAETARTAAETAKTGAETARTGAAVAEDGASQSAGEAEMFALGAYTSATAAETAKTGAETARTAAETAKTAAETAKTGAEAALAATLSAAAIVGLGRPDLPATLTTPGTPALVSAAQSGAEFRSLDGPQGAWVWRKRGSVWTCVEGDTGAIDLSPLLVNGWAKRAGAAALALTIRRIGSMLILAVSDVGLDGTAATNNVFVLDLPVGFRWVHTSESSTVLGAFFIDGGAAQPVTGQFAASKAALDTARGKLVSGICTYPALDAWPTTLTL